MRDLSLPLFDSRKVGKLQRASVIWHVWYCKQQHVVHACARARAALESTHAIKSIPSSTQRLDGTWEQNASSLTCSLLNVPTQNALVDVGANKSAANKHKTTRRM